MFTTNHFIWLGLCFSGIALLLFFALKYKFSFKTATLIVSGIALASELCKIFTDIKPVVLYYGDTQLEGGVLSAGSLPFHLCSILIFFIFYLNFVKDEKRLELVKSLVVPVAFLGGLAAIFIPTSGVEFNDPAAYQCFIYHSGILWYALYLILSKQVNLGFRAYKSNLCLLGGLLFLMIWVNSILQVYNSRLEGLKEYNCRINFFYIVGPPMKDLPILNLDNGWYAYFFTIVGIALAAVTLIHLPFLIMDIKNRNRAKALANAEEEKKGEITV